MRKINRLKFVLLFVLFILSACRYEKIALLQGSGNVSYKNEVQPNFTKSCISGGCHSTGGISPVLVVDDSYLELMDNGFIDTKSPKSSILIEKLTTGGSMSSYVNKSELDLITRWVEQGALDN